MASQCPTCGADMSAPVKSCSRCGQVRAQLINCPTCGWKVSSLAEFCPQCGHIRPRAPKPAGEGGSSCCGVFVVGVVACVLILVGLSIFLPDEDKFEVEMGPTAAEFECENLHRQNINSVQVVEFANCQRTELGDAYDPFDMPQTLSFSFSATVIVVAPDRELPPNVRDGSCISLILNTPFYPAIVNLNPAARLDDTLPYEFNVGHSAFSRGNYLSEAVTYDFDAPTTFLEALFLPDASFTVILDDISKAWCD